MNAEVSNLKRRTLPLGWRVSLHVGGIGCILCLLIIILLLPFQYKRVEKDAIIEARILAEAVATIYQRLGDDQPPDYARRLLLRMARSPHIARVDVLDHKHVVRYSTDSRELGKVYETRLSIIEEDDKLFVTHLVTKHMSSIGSVTVVIDRDLMLSETHRLFVQVGIGLFLMIIILSILVKGLIERLVSSRLERLMNLVVDAERGSFLIRAEVDRNDEIGHVIVGFNQLLGVITQIEARHLEKEHNAKDAQVQRSMRIRLEETLSKLERSNEKLKSKVKAQELLMEAAHRLGSTLKREAVVESLLFLVKEKLSWPYCAVFLIDGLEQEGTYLRLAAFYGFNEKDLIKNIRLSTGEGIIGMVFETGSPLVFGNLEKEEKLKLFEYQNRALMAPEINKTGSLMAVPIIHKGRVIGVFLFCHDDVQAFAADDVTLISALSAQAALAIVNADLYETTLELATSDPLTGVLNRRAMVKQIEFELARVQRFSTTLALLLVDVDHFKAYNDRMGHVLGDVALKEIARTLKENIRKVDGLARFGGEEFCVILPQADIEAATEVADKLCAAVRALKVRGVEKQELGHLSVSIGITIVPHDFEKLSPDTSVTDLISRADQALYEAKKQGRDRFVVYGAIT